MWLIIIGMCCLKLNGSIYVQDSSLVRKLSESLVYLQVEDMFWDECKANFIHLTYYSALVNVNTFCDKIQKCLIFQSALISTILLDDDILEKKASMISKEGN